MEISQKQSEFLNYIKGSAIFLMLWGHTVQFCMTDSELDFFENSLFRFIYSFHMPLFMLVSGFLFFYSFQKRNLTNLLVHRSCTLLPPMIFCSIFNYFISDGLFAAAKFGFGGLLGGLANARSFWYLEAVLICSFYVGTVCKKIQHPAAQLLLLCALMPTLLVFSHYSNVTFMYPYFVIGFFFACYYKRFGKKTVFWGCLAATAAFFLMIPFYHKEHFIDITGIIGLILTDKKLVFKQLQINAFRWLIGLCGSVFAIAVSYKIFSAGYGNVNRVLKGIGNRIMEIGRKSIQYYCLSVAVLSLWLPRIIHYIVLPFWNNRNLLVAHIWLFNFVITPVIALFYCGVIGIEIKILELLKLDRLLFPKLRS